MTRTAGTVLAGQTIMSAGSFVAVHTVENDGIVAILTGTATDGRTVAHVARMGDHVWIV